MCSHLWKGNGIWVILKKKHLVRIEFGLVMVLSSTMYVSRYRSPMFYDAMIYILYIQSILCNTICLIYNGSHSLHDCSSEWVLVHHTRLVLLSGRIITAPPKHSGKATKLSPVFLLSHLAYLLPLCYYNIIVQIFADFIEYVWVHMCMYCIHDGIQAAFKLYC